MAATSGAPETTPSALERYLGPGRVVRVDPAARAYAVALEGGAVVNATLALTFPYRPVLADVLLVISDAEAFWAIGVLEARGGSTLSSSAGLKVTAEDGALRLVGDRGVRVAGERVLLEGGTVERVAIAAKQTFGRWQRRVREELAVEAGEVDELAQKGWVLAAKRATIKALFGARVKSTTVRVG